MEKLNAVIDALASIESFDGLMSAEYGKYKKWGKEIQLCSEVFLHIFGCHNVATEEHDMDYECLYVIIKGVKIFALRIKT